MDKLEFNHLQNIYGLNPNVPHMAFQFPRLPPGLSNSAFKVFENPMKEQFLKQTETINQKLQGFQHMYQQYASGLLSMNSMIIPPGHPLYNKQNSISSLQTENDKLLKENLELKKKLDKKPKSD
jgi:hypothetical protein